MAPFYLPDELFFQAADYATGLSMYINQGAHRLSRRKVSLTRHAFCFLTHGQKEVQLSSSTIHLTNQQALLIGSGNYLMTEQLSDDAAYQSTLLFFTHKNVADFLVKHAAITSLPKPSVKAELPPCFLIEPDAFIHSFSQSLTTYRTLKKEFLRPMLELKFEEILLYLAECYGDSFLNFLQVLLGNKWHFSFQKVVEANVLSQLSLADIAFLCNMSSSTFKRHFTSIYHETPGKWFQHKRLLEARRLLQSGNVKVSDIYLAFGYESLSNFSAAFKNEFGISPRKAALG